MQVTFENGTSQQRSWFNEAMERALFPWDRVETHVTVKWLPEVSGGASDFAWTTWGDPADDCGRPNAATIELRDDLDDPERTVGGLQYRGQPFYMETCVHELGHVVQSKFDNLQVQTLVTIFGGLGFSDWNGPPEWGEKRQESFAETFKDVWLPKPYRKFDNRTAHRVSRDSFESFLEVLDKVCACGGGGALS